MEIYYAYDKDIETVIQVQKVEDKYFTLGDSKHYYYEHEVGKTPEELKEKFIKMCKEDLRVSEIRLRFLQDMFTQESEKGKTMISWLNKMEKI